MREQRIPAGFTLIEVMFSLLIFIVSLMGIVALQHVATNGAAFGKRHTAAVNVASFVLTELQGEFAGWPPHQDYPGLNLSTSHYPLIQAVLGSDQSTTLFSNWQQLGPDGFRTDEYLGHSSLANNDPASHFCINYMIAPLETAPAGAANRDDCKVWKIHVRVSWTKENQFDDTWQSCDPDDILARINANRDEAVVLMGAATREFTGPFLQGQPQ